MDLPTIRFSTWMIQIHSMNIEHRFVSEVPMKIEQGVLYVCIPHDTCLHLCACGCGNEVVTPLATHGWTLTYNGESIGLSPSIGNWNFPCRSHYWIRKNKIAWAEAWLDSQIEAGRHADQRDRDIAFGKDDNNGVDQPWWRRLLNLLPFGFRS